MATVWIPSLLRDLTQGRSTVAVPGATVREVLRNLDAAYPGMAARLCDGDDLSPYVEIAVDNEIVPLGLLSPVAPGSEIHILPAVSGGACSSRRPGLRTRGRIPGG